MSQNQIHCMYCLIKQISQQKGRPLKIICDWDECLQPVNPLIWYKVANEKGWHEREDIAFDNEWFLCFWENSPKEYTERGGESIETAFAFNKHLKNKSRQERRQMTEKSFFKYLKNPSYYEEAPFLSNAEDLRKALKEDLISTLVIVSASNGERKSNKFSKSFGKFSNVELSIQKPRRFRERKEYRWQWIKNNHPDFDIFIDDDPFIIKDSLENFPPDKNFVMPRYKCNEHIQSPNVYRVNTSISDVKDEDFAKAAQKYKDNVKQANNWETWKQRAVGYVFGLLTIIILYGGYLIIKRLRAKQQRK